MSDIKKVSDEFSVGGQPTPEALKQLADQGFKSSGDDKRPLKRCGLRK